MDSRAERDAHWAVTSPDLFTAPGCVPLPDWYESLWLGRSATEHWPQPVDHSAFRLGRYFESLWHHLLTDHRDHRLVAHNLRFEGQGRTLGELDLLVQGSELEHWELTVKLYLCVGDPNEAHHWVGPNLHDTLKKKREHLQHQQLKRHLEPRIKTQLMDQFGREISKVRALIKGWAFYPLATFANPLPQPPFMNPNHLRGWWATPHQFKSWFKDPSFRFEPLEKKFWLSPMTERDVANRLTCTQLIETFKPLSRPRLVAVIDQRGYERERGFLVSDEWLNQAKSAAGLTS